MNNIPSADLLKSLEQSYRDNLSRKIKQGLALRKKRLELKNKEKENIIKID